MKLSRYVLAYSMLKALQSILHLNVPNFIIQHGRLCYIVAHRYREIITALQGKFIFESVSLKLKEFNISFLNTCEVEDFTKITAQWTFSPF